MLSVVRLSDVNGTPVVKMDLPGILRVGDPLRLSFTVRRVNGGRHEILDVEGTFKVEAVGIDASALPHRQMLRIASAGKPPTWRSVKKPPVGRRLGPTRFPPTPI